MKKEEKIKLMDIILGELKEGHLGTIPELIDGIPPISNSDKDHQYKLIEQGLQDLGLVTITGGGGNKTLGGYYYLGLTSTGRAYALEGKSVGELYAKMEKESKKEELSKESRITYNNTTYNNISSITGNNNTNAQITSLGKNAKMNIQTGSGHTTTMDSLKELTEFIKKNLEQLGLEQEDKEDVEVEVQNLERQLKREQPRKSVIKGALSTLHGIFTGISANQLTPVVLEKLQLLSSAFV